MADFFKNETVYRIWAGLPVELPSTDTREPGMVPKLALVPELMPPSAMGEMDMLEAHRRVVICPECGAQEHLLYAQRNGGLCRRCWGIAA